MENMILLQRFYLSLRSFDDIMIQHIYHNNNVIISKIEAGTPLSVLEHEDVLRLPKNYLLCFLHGYSDAVQQLKKAKEYIKSIEDKTSYIKYKEALRVFRKVKYS